MIKVHICLVSEQLVPNVLPILREKPPQVVLLTTEQVMDKSVLLESFFKSRGIKTAKHTVKAFDFQDVVSVCEKIINSFQEAGVEITLNVTGGTKVVALAAFQKFYFDGLRIIYVDTSNNRILELGDKPGSIALDGNLLKVKEYLACYGKQLKQGNLGLAPAMESKRRGKTVEICQMFIHNPELLLEVNKQVARYRDKREKPYFGLFPDTLPEKGEKLCTLLLGAGLATPGIKGSVNINGKEELFYLGGGWLEEYVYGVISDLNIPGIDLCMNLEIEWQSKVKKEMIRNELDIVFTHENRLHIISCKTSGLDKKGPDSRKGKDALYELNTLADNVGGLFARSMLVSAHQLSKYSRQRANNMGIEVISGMEVLGLKKKLQNSWLG